MNKQELIEAIKNEPYEKGIFVDTIKFNRNWLLRKIEKLDEPKKIQIPQFIAEFITEQKKLGHTLSYSIDASMSDIVAEWYWDNSELFALAWILGYEVEEEKRYFVKIKATKHYFAKDGTGKIYFSLAYKGSFTKAELEKAGFGWVFDCEGIEVEEVE